MPERVRVLIVDDSSFYRKRIRSALGESTDIEIVGEAANGEEALQLNRELSPDLVTMDVAMPVMDGITAVRRIMVEHPTRIIMFSALTREGARSTLDALEAGAVDFLPKIGQSESKESSAAGLRKRVLAVARRATPPLPSSGTAASRPLPAVLPPLDAQSPRLLAIGASTGGPMAVQQVLSGLPATFPLPVLVAIHMPAAFTASYAERLDAVTPLQVRQAADGSELRPGSVLVAPGGRQTQVAIRGGRLLTKVSEGGPGDLYKPSIDRLFTSVGEVVGAGALGLVLTGMGSDGAAGAAVLRRAGGRVWAQDRQSSVVYGMPRAVAEAGMADAVLGLDEFAPALAGGSEWTH